MIETLLLIDKGPDAVVASSLIKRLKKDNHDVCCMTDESLLSFFNFCNCESVKFAKTEKQYDKVINLSPTAICTDIIEDIKSDEKLGYGKQDGKLRFFNNGADYHYRTRVIGVPSNLNLFQLLFGIASMPWRGEGYNIRYFPKVKTKYRVGIAIRNYLIRGYVKSNLICEKLQRIPFKYNILKQIDEINRCKTIITDDETIVHLSLALRKQVEFLAGRISYKFESFNSGNLHQIH